VCSRYGSEEEEEDEEEGETESITTNPTPRTSRTTCLCVFCVGPLCGPPLRWWVLCGTPPLSGSSVGGVLPCRVPVSRGICSSSCLALARSLLTHPIFLVSCVAVTGANRRRRRRRMWRPTRPRRPHYAARSRWPSLDQPREISPRHHPPLVIQVPSQKQRSTARTLAHAQK